LSNSSKKEGVLNISEEQKKLLYHDFGMTGGGKVGPRRGLYGGTGIEALPLTSSKTSSKVAPKSPPPSTKSALPLYLKGWGSRNIVSSRCAWAKLRLLEQEQQKMSEISLPSALDSKSMATDHQDVQSEKSWFNEEKAEEDPALALISEATQQYIKGILEGGMNAASQRHNLDGIRIWYQQHTAATVREEKQAQTNGTSESSSTAATKSTVPANITATTTTATPVQSARNANKQLDPPLHLRLGCDVRRQYAMVQGNAAKCSQRFEEALSRSRDFNRSQELDSKTMYEATSMIELSKIPMISNAASNADLNAKRSFEVFGGKYSREPPLGRVPKRAKILVKDFRVCLENSSFMMNRKRVATSAFV